MRSRAVASESFGGFSVRSSGGIETKPMATFRLLALLCALTKPDELNENTYSSKAEVSKTARPADQAELALPASVFILKILCILCIKLPPFAAVAMRG